MLTTLSIANYRSIMLLTLPLGSLNLITGPNGSGKSNLYKALRLLAKTASGGVVNSLAEEGGLHSTYRPGPEELTNAMKRGDMVFRLVAGHGDNQTNLLFSELGGCTGPGGFL